MKNKTLILLIILLSATTLSANDNHAAEINKGKTLIENRISCEKLDDKQLETIGEYTMEQMHPRESHNTMHTMMSMEEGTAYHQKIHTNIARTKYCNDDETMNSTNMISMIPMMNIRGDNTMTNTQGMLGDGMMARWLEAREACSTPSSSSDSSRSSGLLR